ncbi:MAG: serine hydrolase domain-containing protein [Flavobacteriaceae bacterium]|nr:serine hydrolase domain-containing protein [Flavobacteriaceae bacterium]
MRFLILIILVSSFFSCRSESKKIQERNQLIDSVIDLFQVNLLQNGLDSLLMETNFNGSISIYKDSIKLYERTQGFANFSQKKPLDAETVFAVASISKQFTAALILQLQEQGKLNLTDKAANYLSEFNQNNFHKISILQLLNHTSGLNDYASTLAFEPGTDYKYSNKGYNYLGKIIEKVSGKSFEENLYKLLQNAGMTRSYSPENLADNNFASAYYSFGQSIEEVPDMPKRLQQNHIGTAAGGLLTNIADLHRWNKALYSGKILDSMSMKQFTTNYTMREHFILGKVGYGLGIMMNEGKPQSYFHTGYVKGAPSLMIYYPENQTSVMILSNFANEKSSKEEIFLPHYRIKELIDLSQFTAGELRQNLLKQINTD